MLRAEKIKGLIFRSAAVIFVLTIIIADFFYCQEDPFSEIKEKLDGISQQEREILQNLFVFTQEIELLEKEEREQSQEIETIKQDIRSLENSIAEGEVMYNRKRESLKQVLRSYQRMGPASFLEIILESESLSEFLHRVNILRDLTRSTGELLENIKTSEEKLMEDKQKLSLKLSLLEDRQKQAGEALREKMALKKEKEEYLASLKGEREYYQEYLNDLERVWGELKTLVSSVAKEFSRMIEEESLPVEALKLSFSLVEIRGAIDDKTINSVISKNSNLPEMIFSFHPGRVEISMPEKNLVLAGTFVIEEKRILKFQPHEGSFYGMPLKKGSLEELFSKGDMVLNLEPLLAGNEIHGLEIKEGYLELINRLKLF